MSDEKNTAWDWAGVTFVYALSFLTISAGVAVMVLVIRHWAVLNSFGLMLAGQIVIGATATAGASYLSVRVVQSTFHLVKNIQNTYSTQIVAAKRRAPTFFGGAVLIGEAIVLLADKSFRGDAAATIGASLIAFAFFAIANQMGCLGGKWRYIAWIVWFAGVAWIPLAICIDRDWSLMQLVAELMKLQTDVCWQQPFRSPFLLSCHLHSRLRERPNSTLKLARPVFGRALKRPWPNSTRSASGWLQALPAASALVVATNPPRFASPRGHRPRSLV